MMCQCCWRAVATCQCATCGLLLCYGCFTHHTCKPADVVVQTARLEAGQTTLEPTPARKRKGAVNHADGSQQVSA